MVWPVTWQLTSLGTNTWRSVFQKTQAFGNTQFERFLFSSHVRFFPHFRFLFLPHSWHTFFRSLVSRGNPQSWAVHLSIWSSMSLSTWLGFSRSNPDLYLLEHYKWVWKDFHGCQEQHHHSCCCCWTRQWNMDILVWDHTYFFQVIKWKSFVFRRLSYFISFFVNK